MSREEEGPLPGFVAIGRILTSWGVRGDLKVERLAPDTAFAPGSGISICGEEYQIERCRQSARFLYVKLAGIDSPEEARELRGAYLEVREGDLAPLEADSYYRYQLIGLAVRTNEGRDLGRITDVLANPGTDVFVVRGPLGEVLVPATDDVIQKIDLEGRTVTIEAIPGLLPGDE